MSFKTISWGRKEKKFMGFTHIKAEKEKAKMALQLEMCSNCVVRHSECVWGCDIIKEGHFTLDEADFIQRVLNTNNTLRDFMKKGDKCGDNRFKLIELAKEKLISSTNIELSKGEMDNLDSFLFRCWQMGWLDKYEPEIEQEKPKRYRARMLHVDAVQFDGKNLNVIRSFVRRALIQYDLCTANIEAYNCLTINTPDGIVKVYPGDYIVKGTNGFYKYNNGWFNVCFGVKPNGGE